MINDDTTTTTHRNHYPKTATGMAEIAMAAEDLAREIYLFNPLDPSSSPLEARCVAALEEVAHDLTENSERSARGRQLEIARSRVQEAVSALVLARARSDGRSQPSGPAAARRLKSSTLVASSSPGTRRTGPQTGEPTVSQVALGTDESIYAHVDLQDPSSPKSRALAYIKSPSFDGRQALRFAIELEARTFGTQAAHIMIAVKDSPNPLESAVDVYCGGAGFTNAFEAARVHDVPKWDHPPAGVYPGRLLRRQASPSATTASILEPPNSAI